MCGESWHAMKNSLIHRPSSQGWAPGVLPFFVQVFCLSPVCTWMEGWGEEGGYLLLYFFSIIYILGLVCYTHTIHDMYVSNRHVCLLTLGAHVPEGYGICPVCVFVSVCVCPKP